MKKKRKRNYNLKFFLFLCLIVIITVFSYNKFFKSNEIQVVSKINDYPYYLENNDTKVYKKYYKKLEKELKDKKVDEKNYANLVSQLFLIDFYTLSNKVTNQDVGGVEYLHSSIQENFTLKATNTLYKYVKSNVYGNRSQELPTVKDVEVKSIENLKYEYDNIKDESAFRVKALIKYKKDLGYDSEKILILVHEDDILSIVEVK